MLVRQFRLLEGYISLSKEPWPSVNSVTTKSSLSQCGLRDNARQNDTHAADTIGSSATLDTERGYLVRLTENKGRHVTGKQEQNLRS